MFTIRFHTTLYAVNFHNNIPSGYTNKDLNHNDEYEVRGELVVTVCLICVSPNLIIKVVVLKVP